MIGRNDIVREMAKRVYGNSSNSKNLMLAAQFCDNLVDYLTDMLVDGEKIVWNKFFVAEVVERRERHGKDLKTGEPVVFPPAKVINFKLAKQIKDAVKGKT